MAIVIPNVDRIQKENAPLGEALQAEQSYINKNVTQAAGNKVAPPSFVNAAQKQG